MVEKGVPLDRVQVLAGHNSIEMTRRYAETRSESLREAIQQVFDIWHLSREKNDEWDR